MVKYLDVVATPEQLNEKLILFNQGKKYGQVVFMAGGAGSGKGFAISNFMEKEKFKIRDVDEWKKAFQTLADTKGIYPEIQGLKLSNPGWTTNKTPIEPKKEIKIEES